MQIQLQRLPKDLYLLLQEIGKVADQKNLKIYLVGGLVRDLFLGKVRNLIWDLDIVVEGNAISFTEYLCRYRNLSLPKQFKFYQGKIKRYPKFITATLKLKNGYTIDFISARKESYPQPAVLPQVELATLSEDLFRRDFTINAMAVGLNYKEEGRLIDYYGGINDLKNGLIRILHPNSFIDDPTRIFRAVRFAQRFNFKIEKQTARRMKEAIKDNLINLLSAERIKNELKKISSEKRPEKILRKMEEEGILKNIHPHLRLTEDTKRYIKNLKKIKEDLEFVSLLRKVDWCLLFYLKFFWENKDIQNQLIHRFRITPYQKSLIEMTRTKVKKIKNFLLSKSIKPSLLYKRLEFIPEEVLIYILAEDLTSKIKAKILYYLNLKKVRLKISGKDLLKMGYKEGKGIGDALRKTYLAKLDGKIKSREEELNYARRLKR